MSAYGKQRTPVDQLDLLRTHQDTLRQPERVAPHQPSSDTSKAAARKIQAHSTAMRQNVYASIVAAGEKGATRKDLESSTGYLTQTLCARLNELESAGDIRKRTRLSPANEIETVRRDGCSVYEQNRRHGESAA